MSSLTRVGSSVPSIPGATTADARTRTNCGDSVAPEPGPREPVYVVSPEQPLLEALGHPRGIIAGLACAFTVHSAHLDMRALAMLALMLQSPVGATWPRDLLLGVAVVAAGPKAADQAPGALLDDLLGQLLNAGYVEVMAA